MPNFQDAFLFSAGFLVDCIYGFKWKLAGLGRIDSELVQGLWNHKTDADKPVQNLTYKPPQPQPPKT